MTTAQERILGHQRAGELLRARSVLSLAVALWLVLGGAVDLFTHAMIGHGPLWQVLAMRLAATAYQLFMLRELYRVPPRSSEFLDRVIAAVFPLSAISLTFRASRMGGLTSPYVTGMFVIMMVQPMAIPLPWKRAAPIIGLTAAIYPLGMLALARVDATIAAQLANRTDATVFAVHAAVVAGGAIVVVSSGHVIWLLRQSLFESKNIGRYRLVRRIGQGGMGEVWRAHDRVLRREVALKILSPEHGRTPAAIARFEREIQATAELSHPNTVRIHDWGVTADGVWYYAMELLDGVDLGELVRRRGPLPTALAVRLGVAAAEALGEAHARGIVHRDIKPGNLFVIPVDGDADTLKVLDFGVARIADDDAALTQAGAIVGTPGFIAPEVIAGAAGGAPADVYGLAASLFFSLTGRSPAGLGTPPSLLAGVVPADLEAVVLRGLDPDPERRHASGAALAAALVATGLAEGWSGGFRIESPPGGRAAGDAEPPATQDERPRVRARTGPA